MASSQSPRVVLLTGASGGIGQVMTAALLAAGHAVAAVDRDAAALARLAAQHGAAKERLHPIFADLATAAGCEGAVAEARTRFGAIDAVINNAGIGMSSVRPDAEARAPGIAELTPEIWDSFMVIFVRAPVMLVRAALPDMTRRSFGRIVNNTTSYVTMLRVLPYGAAKAALESMSAVWAKELDGSGITVTMIYPGFVATGIRENATGPDGKPILVSPVKEREVMSVEDCAARIVKAIERREREVVMTARGKMGQWLKLLAPSLVDRIARRAIERGR